MKTDKRKSPFLRHWDKAFFALSIMAMIFAYGFISGRYQIFPFSIVDHAVLAAKDWKDNWKSYFGIAATKCLRPAVYEGDGVTRHLPGKPSPGVTFMTGYRGGHIAMWLVDLEGNLLHEWPVSYTKIWPNPAHVKGYVVPTHDFDTQIHGAILFPNGDVIFNFQYLGLAKLNQCGDIIWKFPYMTHHHVYLSEDGTIWVCGRKYHERKSADYPGMNPPFWEPKALQLSQDGKLLQEISILDVIYHNDKQALIYGLRWYDWGHLNCIKVVEPGVAEVSPLFEQGDLMISMRNMHLVFVFDPETKDIKWMRVGPWLNQHDPDFLPDGSISVFDNRRLRQWDMRAAQGGRSPHFDGSRILNINPVTNEIRTIYQGTRQVSFFTNVMGETQYLQNGNFLITESEGGRVFEITPGGKIVWEFVNRFDKNHVAIIEQAHRYSGEYANFTKEDCQ